MKLEIMNIHAGIENKDIIKFIEEIDNKIKKENEESENNIINTSNDKIWVFLMK